MIKDMINMKFGRLLVIKREKNSSSGIARWLCKCDCGNTTIVRGDCLRSGVTTSCGCFVRGIGVRKNFSQVDISCDYCGKLFKEKPSSIKKTEKHFCSTICYSKYRKELDFDKSNAYKGVRKFGESKQVYHRNYCKKHPDRIAHLKARRYARKRNAIGSHTLKEWELLKNKFNYRCAICNEEKTLTVDHIIPLSKGGTDYISNIQPLCRNCNSKKNDKLDYMPTSCN